MKASGVWIGPSGSREGRREIHFADGDESWVYLSSAQSGIPPGFYDAELEVKESVHGGKTVEYFVLSDATPIGMESAGDLAHAAQKITSYGEDVVAAALEETGSEEPSELLAAMKDPEVLKKVKGIGPARAEDLIEKFSLLREGSARLAGLLEAWELPYAPGQARFKWASHYFGAYPSELDILEEHPYVLLSAADTGRKEVWQIESEVQVSPTTWPLKEIDEAACKVRPALRESPERLEALLESAVTSVTREGHTVSSVKRIKRALRRFGMRRLAVPGEEPVRLTEDVIFEAARHTTKTSPVTYQLPSGEVTRGVTSTDFLQMRRTCAAVVRRLSEEGEPFPTELRAKMQRAAREAAPFSLLKGQERAIVLGTSSALSAFQGAAGTGKTATSRALLSGLSLALPDRRSFDPVRGKYETFRGRSILMLSPSGAGAQRIREGLSFDDPRTGEPARIGSTDPQALDRGGAIQLGTMHSFLGYMGEGRQWKLPPPASCVLYIDEFGTADIEVFYQLCRWIERSLDHGKDISLILCGDPNQLPPVGPGFPFRDLTAGPLGSAVPLATLEYVHRQREGSELAEASARVLEGELPYAAGPKGKGYTVGAGTSFEWKEPFGTGHERSWPIEKELVQYARRLGRAGVTAPSGRRPEPEDIQVILPLRNQSKVEPQANYLRALNPRLQKLFARRRGASVQSVPAAFERDPSLEPTLFDLDLAVGDKVVHKGRNGYHAEHGEPIMRGSQGVVESIFGGGAVVDYPFAGEPVPYPTELDVGQLAVSWATTAHSSQGSQYPFVFLDVPRKAGPGLIDRAWIYVGVTRASEAMHLRAPRARLRRALRTSQGLERETLLSLYLR